jgi:chromosome segregation ATPase
VEARRGELDELRRERDDERRAANAKLDELERRAEEAEARVAAREAELGKGVLGRLRALCKVGPNHAADALAGRGRSVTRGSHTLLTVAAATPAPREES